MNNTMKLTPKPLNISKQYLFELISNNLIKDAKMILISKVN